MERAFQLKDHRALLSSQIALVIFQNKTPQSSPPCPLCFSNGFLIGFRGRGHSLSCQGCRRRTSTSWRITLSDKLSLARGRAWQGVPAGGLFALVSAAGARCFRAIRGAQRRPMRGWNYRVSDTSYRNMLH